MKCRSLAGSFFFFEDSPLSSLWCVKRPKHYMENSNKKTFIRSVYLFLTPCTIISRLRWSPPPPKKKPASIFGAIKLNSGCRWSDLRETGQSQRQEPEKSLVRTTERKRANEKGKRLKVRQPGWLMASKVPRRWATCEITHVRFFSGLGRKL